MAVDASERRTEMTAYNNFLASVNPALLETERFGIPGPEERPGSPEDRMMRRQHEMERIWFWAQRTGMGVSYGAPMSDAEIAECAAEFKAFGQPKRKYVPKKTKTARITAERQLQIAVEAAERKAS